MSRLQFYKNRRSFACFCPPVFLCLTCCRLPWIAGCRPVAVAGSSTAPHRTVLHCTAPHCTCAVHKCTAPYRSGMQRSGVVYRGTRCRRGPGLRETKRRSSALGVTPQNKASKSKAVSLGPGGLRAPRLCVGGPGPYPASFCPARPPCPCLGRAGGPGPRVALPSGPTKSQSWAPGAGWRHQYWPHIFHLSGTM